MNNIIISQATLAIAILTTGVVYGTDMFYAVVMRKANALSRDNSIADQTGHTHLVADKRMAVIGITSVISTTLCVVLNFQHAYMAYLSGAALLMLLAHLGLYTIVAKPINKIMSDAAVNNIVPLNIRALQNRWDSVIVHRAVLLTVAMVLLIIATMVCTK